MPDEISTDNKTRSKIKRIIPKQARIKNSASYDNKRDVTT
jgi:hypothetical protein